MIKFDNVSKKFPLGNYALKEVSFQIDDNEFIFLVGASGAGKTTILKLILREISPSYGSIFVNGTDVADKKFKDIENLRRSLGVVFQDFKILFDKNVFENVAQALKVINAPKKNIKKEVAEVLELVGIEDKKWVFPMQLSAGELQRVAIARAIIGDRNIILADEPTGNLDPKTSLDIMKIFKKLEGMKTIIIATHNSEIVDRFKKRVMTVKDGKIIKDKREGGYEV